MISIRLYLANGERISFYPNGGALRHDLALKPGALYGGGQPPDPATIRWHINPHFDPTPSPRETKFRVKSELSFTAGAGNGWLGAACEAAKCLKRLRTAGLISFTRFKIMQD